MGKKIIFSVVLGLLIFSVSIAFSFAWFAISESFFPDVSGDSVTGYFKDGDGSPDDPYIIETPTHVYNLAWLQYIGLLNQETTDSEGNPIITQYYFKISDEIDVIDMDGVVIPPIGTKDKPFVGHFDGNGKCISNLTVSNYLADGENEFGIEKRPLSVTTIEEDVSIVGFFGVVGALDEETKKKLADDSEIENIEEKVNAVYDLFLDNLTVRTETDRSLIGLFAGYVNGSVTNVGIGTSSIAVGEDTTPLTAEDAFDMQLTISAYSLIGKYDETNVVWVDKPTGGSGGGSDVGGSGAGWGGSFNMLELNKRMTYIVGASPDVAKNTYTNYSIDYLNFVGTFYGTGSAYKAASKIIYFAKNTILPLNIDGNMLSDEISGNNGSVTTNEYKNASEKETVSASNTGYLVGGGEAGSSADIRLRAYTITSGSYNGIYKSLGTAKVTNGTFDGANFEMLTVTPKGETYVIGDKYNVNASTGLTSYAKKMYSELGFTQYCKFEGEKDNGVRMAIVNTLQGQTLFHGIHFMPRIDTSALNTTIFDAEIGNKTLKNYEAIDGALNFTVQNSGTITAIAATNFSQSGSHSLFYLYKVERNADNSISNVVEIKTIHKNLNPQNGELLYAYNLSNADSSKYTLLYDSSTMNKLKEAGAAYYFEIPVNAGDYAIGCKTGDSAGAYLMYLDIGANGAASDSGGEDGPTVVPSHKMTAVTFVDSAAIANKTTENYSVVTFEVNIGSKISEHDGLTMNFKRTSPTYMSYSQNDPSSAFTVTMVKDDAQLSVEKVQNMLIADLQKKRYFRRKDVAI